MHAPVIKITVLENHVISPDANENAQYIPWKNLSCLSNAPSQPVISDIIREAYVLGTLISQNEDKH